MINWIYKPFELLTVQELYSILKLRSEVFVVEQNCAYLDIDDKDQAGFHLCGWVDDSLAAYARLLTPGTSYAEASIGRVVTSPLHRSKSFGKELMNKAIESCLLQFDTHSIRIGAQLYLEKFYIGFGFKRTSDIYLEDGIEHIEMLLNK